MKQFIIIILCILCLKSVAQKNVDKTEFKVSIDSVKIGGTIVENNQQFSSKTLFLRLQLTNNTKEDIMIQRDIYSIYHGNFIDYELQVYSSDVKKFIDIKTPEDKIEEIIEDNLQPLKPNEIMLKKGRVDIYPPLGKQCRIRLIFLVSRDNKNLEDVKSNWITL